MLTPERFAEAAFLCLVAAYLLWLGVYERAARQTCRRYCEQTAVISYGPPCRCVQEDER